MPDSILTIKGRTTVPQAIRDALHAEAGDKLTWHLLPEGTVLVRVKNKPLSDLAGMLKPPNSKKTRIQDMNAWL